MKRLYAYEGKVVALEVPEPTLRSGEVLVAPAYSAISTGTELATIRLSEDPARSLDHNYPGPMTHLPKIRSEGVRLTAPSPREAVPGYAMMGYSLAGVVVDTAADILDLRVGDRVACGGSQAAQHAEYVAVPRNLCARVPDGVALAHASLTTLGAIAMHALRLSNATFGGTVVLYGLGVLGLIGTQLARTAGIYAIGLDPDAIRRNQALGFGAIAAADPLDEAVATTLVQELTDGLGADGVVLGVTTSSSNPLNHSFELCRQRGVVVGLGAFGSQIDRHAMVWNDVTLVMALAYGPGRYDSVYEEGGVDYPIGYVRWTENRNFGHFLRLLEEQRIDVSSLARERVSFVDAPDAYARLTDADRPPTLLLDYGRDPDTYQFGESRFPPPRTS